MIKLDSTTFIVSQIILGIIYAVTFLQVHRLYPYLGGTRVLSLAFLSASAARLLYILPDPLGIYLYLGNILALAAAALFYVAILRYFDSCRSSRAAWIVTGIAILPNLLSLALAALNIHVSDAYLLVLNILLIAAFFLLRSFAAAEFFRHSGQRKLLRVFGFFMATYAVYTVVFGILNPLIELSSRMSLLFGNVLFSALLGFFFLFLLGTEIIHHAERQSLLDPLTGKLNRRGIDQRLVEEIARAVRQGDIFSVALIDLDRFKSINDTFGHAAGDKALRLTADLLAHHTRVSDHIGRFGGDELIMILPSTRGHAAMLLAERICQAVLNAATDESLPLSLSIGVAQYEVTDTPELLLARADKALFRAKQDGRSCVRFEALSLPGVSLHPR
ncbi:MAG TPA: GGDEF domain-containing protein [Edaphobacter sp.]